MKEKEMMKQSDNSSGVVGVVFGILGLVLIFPVGLPGVIFGIIGLCFAMRQRKVSANSWSTAGIWMSLIAIILGAIVTYFWIIGVTQILQQYQSQLATAQGAGNVIPGA